MLNRDLNKQSMKIPTVGILTDHNGLFVLFLKFE